MLQTPILLLVFNRPDTTAIVLAKIKQVKPKQLFVAADGPRIGNKTDIERCRLVKELIEREVDWDCELITRFNKENLGCGINPANAITWFFEHIEQGIILEDDIDPSISFFFFCEELLNMYKDEYKVMTISGSNLLDDNTIKSSYVFSNYAGNWGWASWRRAWNNYDYLIQSWGKQSSKKKIKKKFSKDNSRFLISLFDSVHNISQNHIWDYQWWYHRLINEGLGIIPSKNLTRNIGFRNDATHTFEIQDEIKNLIANECKTNLTHPTEVKISKHYDDKISSKYYSTKKQYFFQRIIKKVCKETFQKHS